MAWRQHGRARVSPSSPSAFGVCDRCSIWYNLRALRWQYEYAGTRLQNQHILVCDRCLDNPQPQLKARILPPDPVPVMNARPEQFFVDETTLLATNDGLYLVTHDGSNLVTN